MSGPSGPQLMFLGIIGSIVCLATLSTPASAYFLVIDAHGEECFFERVTSGTKMGLTFEVAEGGFLDIDVTITGPDQKVIHQEQRVSNGKYTFAAHMDGDYAYCFNNQMSTMTHKILMFSMDIHEKDGAGATGADGVAKTDGDSSAEHHKLEEQITDLTNALTAVKHEQEYMSVRERVHRSISDGTNSRVVMWAAFEALLLTAMSLGQIFYLRRFFEVRRVV